MRCCTLKLNTLYERFIGRPFCFFFSLALTHYIHLRIEKGIFHLSREEYHFQKNEESFSCSLQYFLSMLVIFLLQEKISTFFVMILENDSFSRNDILFFKIRCYWKTRSCLVWSLGIWKIITIWFKNNWVLESLVQKT